MRPTERRRLPQPPTLGAKLGGVFLVFAGLLTAVCAVVLANLGQVGLDADKLVEENREARLSDRLLSQLAALDTFARLPPGPERRRLIAVTLEEARRSLGEIYDRPAATASDPSRPEHQAEENRMDRELRRSLDAVAAALDGRPAELAMPMARLRVQAAALEAETREEAGRAAADLERRVRRLSGAVLACSLASAAVLLLAFGLVRRDILTPVRRLHQGTELFAAGRLDHRVEVSSRDEIGELARAFNRMAESLARHRQELEEQVQERTRELFRAAKLADLGTLAAGLAHEVNSPLASIASCAEGLERRLRAGQDDREQALDYLHTIAREAYRAHDITARLLTLARTDPGPLRPLRVDDRVREAAEVLRPLADRRRLRVEIEAEPGLPEVEGNGPEMEQVFVNLLKNALEASPDGATVRVSCRRGDPGEVRIEVRDRGTGLAESDLSQLFDPFFTTKAPGEGTGLGLSLAHRIVERHGGRIEATNAPDGGACFRVVLPAALPEPQEAAG